MGTWHMPYAYGICHMAYAYALCIWHMHMAYAIWHMHMAYAYGICMRHMHMPYAYGICIWHMHMAYAYGIYIWHIHMAYAIWHMPYAFQKSVFTGVWVFRKVCLRARKHTFLNTRTQRLNTRTRRLHWTKGVRQPRLPRSRGMYFEKRSAQIGLRGQFFP